MISSGFKERFSFFFVFIVMLFLPFHNASFLGWGMRTMRYKLPLVTGWWR